MTKRITIHDFNRHIDELRNKYSNDRQRLLLEINDAISKLPDNISQKVFAKDITFFTLEDDRE